ncbi:hypothetical protein MMC07_001700 [Pseudocyphellaria aurata]|nr:hypothetical protein [Pseudocyphellaria aurata]
MADWKPCTNCMPPPLHDRVAWFKLCETCQQNRLRVRSPILRDRGYRAHLARKVLGTACLTQCPETPKAHATWNGDDWNDPAYRSIIEWASEQFARPWDDYHVTAFEVLAGEHEVEDIKYCPACLEDARAKFEVNELIRLCDKCLTMRKNHIEYTFKERHDFHEPWERLALDIAYPDEFLKNHDNLGYDRLIDGYLIEWTFGVDTATWQAWNIALTVIMGLPTPIILALTLRHDIRKSARTERNGSNDVEMQIQRGQLNALQTIVQQNDAGKRDLNARLDTLQTTVQQKDADKQYLNARLNTLQTAVKHSDANNQVMNAKLVALQDNQRRQNETTAERIRELEHSLRISIQELRETLEAYVSGDLGGEAPDWTAQEDQVRNIMLNLRKEREAGEEGEEEAKGGLPELMKEVQRILSSEKQSKDERVQERATEALKTIEELKLPFPNEMIEGQVGEEASEEVRAVAKAFVEVLHRENSKRSVRGNNVVKLLDKVASHFAAQLALRQHNAAKWQNAGNSGSGAGPSTGDTPPS